MYTRQQYLNKEVDHRTYYGQFVTQDTRLLVSLYIGVPAITTSTDEHFNDIPLKLWDACASTLSIRTGQTLCETVCICKEAARQVKEAQ